jgi:hypothetical protein
MAQILLTHPVHGSKFALTDTEVEQDEKHGWTRYTDDTPKVAATRKPRKAKAEVEETVQPEAESIEQPNETPEFLAPVSDESEGN